MNDIMGGLEEKVYDPWGLFGRKYPSNHCTGKKSEIIVYDHTGYEFALCDCGEKYVHDQGVYKAHPQS